MKVAASLVADGEAAEASQPRQCALHDPAVAFQMLAAAKTHATSGANTLCVTTPWFFALSANTLQNKDLTLKKQNFSLSELKASKTVP